MTNSYNLYTIEDLTSSTSLSDADLLIVNSLNSTTNSYTSQNVSLADVTSYLTAQGIGGGVTQIVAGTGVSVTPTDGKGVVTIDSTISQLTFGGATDLTSSLVPSVIPLAIADYYVNTGSGQFSPEWAAITDNASTVTDVHPGDYIIYNGTTFEHIPVGTPPVAGGLWLSAGGELRPLDLTDKVVIGDTSTNTSLEVTGKAVSTPTEITDTNNTLTTKDFVNLNNVLLEQNSPSVTSVIGNHAEIKLENNGSFIDLNTKLNANDSSPGARFEVTQGTARSVVDSDGHIILANQVNPNVKFRARKASDNLGYGQITLTPASEGNPVDERAPSNQDGILTIQSGEIRIVDLANPLGYILTPGGGDLDQVLINQNNVEVIGSHANIKIKDNISHIWLETDLKDSSGNPFSRIEVSDYDPASGSGSQTRIDSNGRIIVADKTNPNITFRELRVNSTLGYGQIKLTPQSAGTPTEEHAPDANDGILTIQSGQIRIVDLANPNGYILTPGGTPPSANESTEGIVRLANFSETSAGSSSTLAVNPANLIGTLANYPYRSEVLLLNVTTEQKIQGNVNFQDSVFVQNNLACNNVDRTAAFTANAPDYSETIAIQTRSNQFHMSGGYAIKNYTYPDGILRSYMDKYGNIWGNTLTSVYIAGATIGVTSDQKYKTNITDYNVSELSDIKTLGQSLKYYYWNQDAYVRDEERNVQQFGLIAQEVEAIDSSLVKTAYKKNDTVITPEQTDENGNFLAAAVTETTEESYKTIDLGVLVSKILKATSEVIVKSEAMEAALSSINTAASTAGTLEQLKSDIASATSNF